MTGAARATRPAAGYHGRRARVVGGLFTGVWLLYLAQPVAALLTRPYTVPYRVSGLAIIGLFAVVYVIAVPNWPFSPRYALPALAALAALAVAACLLFGRLGASTLWIFVSSASGLLVPSRRRATAAVLAAGASYLVFSVTGHVGRASLLLNLLPTIFVGLAMVGLRRQFELTAQLARAREEVAQLAANEERLRLARDMHDLTGQSLSMITLKSELAARLMERLPASPELDRARDEIGQVAAVSRQTLRDIREAISGYRRPTLAVEVITARTALASAGITAHEDAELTLLSGAFGADQEAALAWCLREAVTNVIRHSGARNCHISLTQRSGTVSLTVRDDGSGLRPDECGGGPPLAGPLPRSSAAAAASGTRTASGTGLHGMAERLRAVGGRLELFPAGDGFRLLATVPEHPAAADRPAARREPADRTGSEISRSGASVTM